VTTSKEVVILSEVNDLGAKRPSVRYSFEGDDKLI